MVWKKCEPCNGSGILPDGKTCLKCNGKGSYVKSNVIFHSFYNQVK